MTELKDRRPAHHHPDGGFHNHWAAPKDRSFRALFKWMWSRWRDGTPPDPTPDQLPHGPSDVAVPRAALEDTRITWIGHATFLIQHRGLNVLTDPQWSRRAAPVQWAGPARLAPPGYPFDRLPPIDAVLISHDHYDHLDDNTVRRLVERYGDQVRWFTPLGYRSWLSKRGASDVVEMDWWDEANLSVDGGDLTVTALPAQHWTRRGLVPAERLWASWAVQSGGSAVYFGGDSGYFHGFSEIGERLGPFDACLLPIGAYEPRWFMAPDHMNPEEAVQAYQDLGGAGSFIPMHWGTFRLTDEDPLEPPVRTRSAWEAAGLPADRLRIARHGETIML